MTWSASASFYYTFWWVAYPGKEWKRKLELKSMKLSKTWNKKSQSRNLSRSRWMDQIRLRLRAKPPNTWTNRLKRRLEAYAIVMTEETQTQIGLRANTLRDLPTCRMSSSSSWSTAANWSLRTNPITPSSVECSRTFSTEVGTRWTTFTIGLPCCEKMNSKYAKEQRQSLVPACNNSKLTQQGTQQLTTQPRTITKLVVQVLMKLRRWTRSQRWEETILIRLHK